MKRTWLVLFNLILVASLLAVGSVRVQAAAPAHWTQIPLPAQVSPYSAPTALEVFKGQLFASFLDFDQGASIWRMEKDGRWTQANQFGFGTPDLFAVPDMISFNGMLYATATDWAWRLPAAQLWRSPDGFKWEPVTTTGFDQPYVSKLNLFAVFKDMLYVSASMYGSEGFVGVQIWRSATGAPGTWQKVVDQGLGDLLATDTTAMIVFNGALYAILETDWQHPARVWRTLDGVNWTVVTNDGFGNPFNLSPGGAAVFQDTLYVGMHTIDWSKVDYVNPAKNPGPGQIWWTKDGLHWTPVKMEGGFGDWHNYKVDSLYTFEGRIYAGTLCYDWVNDVKEEGVQIWSSPDGMHWTQVNRSGFGDKHNYATHLSVDVAAYNGSLYYGTWNDADSGQIWKLGH